MQTSISPSTHRAAVPGLLVTLARDGSETGRTRLIAALGDYYLQPGQTLEDIEAAQLDAFIAEITGSLPKAAKHALATRAAQRLSTDAALPSGLARTLILDEIEIAGPVLAKAPLADDDLLAAIGLKRTPHSLAIAGRAAVSEAVADALVLTGDAAVVETLLKNLGATLGRDGVAKCIDLARQVQALRLPLVNREEFTAADAAQLLWWLPRELRQIVADRFGQVTAAAAMPQISPAGKSATAPSLEVMLQAWTREPPKGAAAQRAAAWVAAQPNGLARINGDLLVKTLRLRLESLYTALIMQRTGLPQLAVERCCTDKTGQLLAVLARTLGIEKAQFASLFMLSFSAFQNGKPLAPAALGVTLAAFDRITPARAATMVNAWRADPELVRARA